MAMATRISEGKTIPYTPGAAVEAGDVIRQVDLIGVAPSDIAANVEGSIDVSGVFDFPKDTGSSSAIPAGTIVYWNYGDEVATASSSSAVQMGKTIQAATDDDATVRVLLIP